MMRFFHVIRRGNRNHFVAARIHAFGQPLDIAPFSGGVPAFVKNHDRHALEVNQMLQLENALLAAFQLLVVFLLRQRDR